MQKKVRFIKYNGCIVSSSPTNELFLGAEQVVPRWGTTLSLQTGTRQSEELDFMIWRSSMVMMMFAQNAVRQRAVS